jgi:hypothetical protein
MVHVRGTTPLPEGFEYKLRGNKVSRILARIQSRKLEYPAVDAANSVEAATNSRDAYLFHGFNRNPLRGKIMQSLARTAGCTVFVETGCGKGATALCVHSFVKLPVWSCENSLMNYMICKCLAAGLNGMDIQHSDSRDFLLRSNQRLAANPKEVPFFFLDAHGGVDGTGITGDSLPILEEIEIIHKNPRFVAVIDDVQLPGFPGGKYGDVVLDMKHMTPTLLRQGTRSCWVPNYGTTTDIGWPSGYCIFSRGVGLDQKISSSAFPLNLLRKLDLGQDL